MSEDMPDFDENGNVVTLSSQRKKTKPKAKYADYVQLVHDVLGSPLKRDLFSWDLMYWNTKRQRWSPVLQTQAMGKLKSKAHDSSGFYSPAYIESHMLAYEDSLTPELLVEIPAWDGIDRLSHVAECIKCKSYSSAFVAELLKDWFARLFLRLDNPVLHQNRILLLQGAEGLGKDTLFRALVGGLGQFCTGFTVQAQEKDSFDLVCGAAVLNINEFERLYKSDMGLMKSIITEPEYKYRPSHERKSEFKTARSSFIGTCNRDDILKDSGLNRRYIILDVEAIAWEYPQNESLQCLAQGRELAKIGFKASRSAEAALRTYLDRKTPESDESFILGDYVQLFSEKYGKTKQMASKMSDLWDILSKRYTKLGGAHLRSLVKTAGYGRREGPGVFYWGELGFPTYNQSEWGTENAPNVEEELPF